MNSSDNERNARFYRKMRLIRRFEETLLELFEEGLLTGTTHCYIGQEANAVGIFEHLEPGDHVFSNHRCHGHYISQTGDARGLLAEIMGKRQGVCGGIGGSQHIWAPQFKSNGILGGTVPAAAGVAFAMKLDGTNNISCVFIGDGTLGEGAVYETLNLASLWSLPLLIVLENNHWSQSTPITANLAGDIELRFEAFGIPARRIASTDVLEVDTVAEKEIAAVRASGTPRALIIDTYRLCHHSKSSDGRPEEEVKKRWASEPLAIHAPRLAPEVRSEIEAEIETFLDELVQESRGLC